MAVPARTEEMEQTLRSQQFGVCRDTPQAIRPPAWSYNVVADALTLPV
jgi:hypothetical protein